MRRQLHGVTFQKAVITTAVIASDLPTQTLAGTARLCTVSPDWTAHTQYFVLSATSAMRQTIRTVVLRRRTDLLTNKQIHSFHSLPYDRPIASSTAASPQSAISASSLNFQYTLFSLRSSSSCLHLLPRLIFIFILPSIVAVYIFFLALFLFLSFPL